MGWEQLLWALPAVISAFTGDKGQDQAAGMQGAFNKVLLDMFKKRQNMELPFRQNLLNTLQSRSQQQIPTFKLPAQPPAFNPWANTRTSMPLGALTGGDDGAREPQKVRPMMDFLKAAQGLPQQKNT